MRITINIALVIFFAPLLGIEPAFADDNCSNLQSAKLESVQGELYFSTADQTWKSAKLFDLFCEGSKIKLSQFSRATLSLPSGIILRLAGGTEMTLSFIAAEADPAQKTESTQNKNVFDIVKGFVHFISRTPRHLQINTPIANAGPLGTEFAFKIDDKQAQAWVYEGDVRFFNAQGQVDIKAGQTAKATLGNAPESKISLKPEDAVKWALYYPPLLPELKQISSTQPELKAAIDDFRHGDIEKALHRIDALVQAKDELFIRKVRGAMRLMVGQVELAKEDIQQLLANNPNDAEGLALQSVLEVSLNHKAEAYDLANRAVAANPNSAAAYTALSYAEQARFQLDKALAAAKQAVNYSPSDSMAWARKAELELSEGLFEESEKTIQRALQLDSQTERTQTIAGFAYLLRTDTDNALESFATAVNIDSTAPLPRLGLALTKIRRGDVSDGRKDLEIAAILDPNNSLIRSYLGKAYYEERRSHLADEQFRLAKSFDPKDPTPYFYDSINKLTTNRVIEALKDQQSAIELNDNRAVYRSGLHLDKDLAARSAAQGRIYNELGFQQRGLLEGWKSVNRDFSNYSAHRLLADNYAALPRHEIARVSELLQSQLLQPVNITPIQPNLAESNLLILNGLGPANLSFNEFNPLFEYNRISFQTSGIYGSNNTLGDNATISGIQDRFSFNLGQFHYNTDGFRENNFLKSDIYNAFFQNQFSDKFNLQFEYRHEERKNGDLGLGFNLNNFNADFNERRKIDAYRIGGRYEINENSAIIGSLIYQDVDIVDNTIEKRNFSGFSFALPLQISSNRNGFISELQHIYKNKSINIISGFRNIDQQNIITTDSFDIVNSLDLDLTRTSIYNYSKLKLNNHILPTLGFSFDIYKDGTFNQTALNPKFGLEWANSFTNFRVAVFRSTSVARTANQTIEPTQVAGFNQFFDDPDGSTVWRYGAGLDHKFSNSLLGGLEYSERKLNIPGFSNGTDRNEQLARAYLYKTLSENFILNFEYFFERISQTESFAQVSIFNSDSTFFTLAETHRLPITLNVFLDNGFFASIKNSYVVQQGVFQRSSTNIDDSDFNIVDLNFGYRLPKRVGIITFGVNNLLNQKINFQNTSFNDQFISPGQVIFTRISLAY